MKVEAIGEDGKPFTGPDFYGDARSPDDMVDHSILRYRASVAPRVPGVRVYFLPVDVDDPSDDEAPIDDESREEDNRGVNPPLTSALTDRNGQATVALRMPMQPGDNLVVVASTGLKYLRRLRNIDANGDGDEVYEYPSGLRQPTKRERGRAVPGCCVAGG